MRRSAVVLSLSTFFLLSSTLASSSSASSPPEHFKVEFQTTVNGGDKFVVEVTRDWSPKGADRFYELVQDGFYDDAGFFRVVPKFVVQFGLAADPEKTAKWKHVIADDPKNKANDKGTIVFATAGKGTRTTQLFVNLSDNHFLDNMGFTPFGKVVSGMETVQAITSKYGEKPHQGQITSQGNAYLKKTFPELDYITKATIVQD